MSLLLAVPDLYPPLSPGPVPLNFFCAKRRVPIGVYVFRSMDRGTGEYPANALTIILWLRETDSDFYNDFSLMVGRVKPLTLEIDCGVMTPDDVSGVTLLQTCTPLWPVMPSTPYRRVGEMGRSLLLFRVSIRD